MLVYLALEFGVSSQLISYYNNSDYYQMITQEIVERRRMRQMDRMRRLMFDPDADGEAALTQNAYMVRAVVDFSQTFAKEQKKPEKARQYLVVVLCIVVNIRMAKLFKLFFFHFVLKAFILRDLDMWDLWQENQRRERLRQQQLEQEDNDTVIGEIVDGFGFSVLGNITQNFMEHQQNNKIIHQNTNEGPLMNQEVEEAKDEKFDNKKEIYQNKINEKIRNPLNPEEQLENEQNSSFD